MRKVALRGLFARKLRLVLTALAVALGVTLIAGTYVFTDTINRSFDQIFTAVEQGHRRVDHAAQGDRHDRRRRHRSRPSRRPCSPQVRAQPGVPSAEGSVFDVGTVLGKDGKRIGAGGAPNFIASIAEQPRFDALHGQGGPPARRPRTRSRSTRRPPKKQDFKLGDKVAVAGRRAPRKDYTLVGVDPDRRRRLVRRRDRRRHARCPRRSACSARRGFDQIEVAAKPGVTPEQLRDQLRTRAAADGQRPHRPGGGAQAVQGHQGQPRLPARRSCSSSRGIALFVGAFIIFNTFSITVAQRMREFALLRTLGASRGQVLRSVLGEGAD